MRRKAPFARLLAMVAAATGAFLAVARGTSDSAGEEAVRIAENMLLYQRDNGGWPQRYPSIDYTRVISDRETARIEGEKKLTDTMLDNGATHTQLQHLARVATATEEERFKAGFLRGVNYLLAAQMPCGGWAKYENVDFGDGTLTHVRAWLTGKCAFDLRLGSPEGRLIGTIAAGESMAKVEPVKGRQTLFLVFQGNDLPTDLLDSFVFMPGDLPAEAK